ncbi:MAG TPA: carboxypeptidase regulatory-like domain-containing protein, partial [Bryobacteraceae bacterium]|nr:carboxypeptidase regulatory-like domain-containing protein [Bryobacteraceae bacterium]
MQLLRCIALICTIAAGARAQNTASISGNVRDPSGAAVDGAQMTLTSVESGATRKAATNRSGFYTFLQLPADAYEIQAEKTGFKIAAQRGIVLAVGQDAAINLNLQLGRISEEVVVNEAATPVGTEVAQTSGVVTGTQIRDLPLNGRSYDQLLTLNPGIVSFTTQKNNATPGISNSAVANMFAAEGRRPQENLFLVDGIEYTGAAEINMTPGGTSGELLGVDAIREFNVLTGTYGAEYGKRPGAQVLVVSRSGTNEFHGSAYEFLRNSSFDARNFFDRGAVPGFQRNQFGGSAGGALSANRTFLFGDYEGLRQNLRLSNVTLVPDDNARLGILPDGRHVAVDPVAARLLALWPVQSPNSPFDSGGIAEAFSSPKQTIREDFGTARLDQILSERDTLAGNYTVDDSADSTPTANPLALDIESLREQVASLRETHIFSADLVNT